MVAEYHWSVLLLLTAGAIFLVATAGTSDRDLLQPNAALASVSKVTVNPSSEEHESTIARVAVVPSVESSSTLTPKRVATDILTTMLFEAASAGGVRRAWGGGAKLNKLIKSMTPCLSLCMELSERVHGYQV